MKTTPASFKVGRTDANLISQIVDRAMADLKISRHLKLEVDMDITACHANGCPLDLRRLLAAPLPDFGHDIHGIRRFIDRSTGEITGHFHPRCSYSE